MKVTIGERLGVTPRVRALGTSPPAPEPPSDDAVPTWIEPEHVLRLASLPSARTVPVDVWPDEEDTDVDIDPGPPRMTGHMEFIHKTAPVLVIHGRSVISPEEYAAGRRR